jgi:hypothetical protein
MSNKVHGEVYEQEITIALITHDVISPLLRSVPAFKKIINSKIYTSTFSCYDIIDAF